MHLLVVLVASDWTLTKTMLTYCAAIATKQRRDDGRAVAADADVAVATMVEHGAAAVADGDEDFVAVVVYAAAAVVGDAAVDVHLLCWVKCLRLNFSNDAYSHTCCCRHCLATVSSYYCWDNRQKQRDWTTRTTMMTTAAAMWDDDFVGMAVAALFADVSVANAADAADADDAGEAMQTSVMGLAEVHRPPRCYDRPFDGRDAHVGRLKLWCWHSIDAYHSD